MQHGYIPTQVKRRNRPMKVKNIKSVGRRVAAPTGSSVASASAAPPVSPTVWADQDALRAEVEEFLAEFAIPLRPGGRQLEMSGRRLGSLALGDTAAVRAMLAPPGSPHARKFTECTARKLRTFMRAYKTAWVAIHGRKNQSGRRRSSRDRAAVGGGGQVPASERAVAAV